MLEVRDNRGIKGTALDQGDNSGSVGVVLVLWQVLHLATANRIPLVSEHVCGGADLGPKATTSVWISHEMWSPANAK